jgi:iron complex transport system substrate-binding protein
MVRARMAAGEDLYTLDEGALRTINPDFVVTQDLCAVCAVDISEVDQALAHLGCQAQVITLDPMTLDEVLLSIETVGRATGSLERALELVGSLRQRLHEVARSVAGEARPRMAVLEWTDPPFSSGHWMPDMVTAAGAESVLGVAGERSRQVEWEAVTAARPDVVVVAPCGYRLDGAAELAEQVVHAGVLPPGVPVWAVDADAAFVRPGPRVVDGVETLAHIAHPESVRAPLGMAELVRKGPGSATSPR